jgi:hypothetical protein
VIVGKKRRMRKENKKNNCEEKKVKISRKRKMRREELGGKGMWHECGKKWAYPVKKVINFPVPRRDVTFQTLPGRE